MLKFKIAINARNHKPLPATANRDLFYSITYSLPYDYQNPIDEPAIKMGKVNLDSDGKCTLTVKPRAKTLSFSIQVNKFITVSESLQ